MSGVVRFVLASVVVAAGLAATALVLLNRDPVRLQLGVVDLPPVPVGTATAAALGGGVLIGLVMLLPALARRRGARRRLEARVAELEREVKDLRTLPLQGDG